MKYRILLINWQDIANPKGGGAEVHAHQIFKRIAGKGHEVIQFSCLFPNAPREETIDGIRVMRCGGRKVFNFMVPAAYKKLSRQMKLDIVIDDINKIPFYTPLFVREPLVGIVHHLFGKSILLETSWIQAHYVLLGERLIPRIYKHKRLVAVSESTRRELNQWGISNNNIDIVLNGIDPQQYYILPGMKDPNPLIGYYGRLKKYKCIDHLIRALGLVVRQIPNARLLIVGMGDYQKELERLVGKLNLNPYVRFVSTTHPHESVKYLNQMWVVANPSPKEGWGLTVIEANACGTPVVAADSQGLRDSVIDGETGFLYPWGDIDRLADRIVQIISNKKLRQKLERGAENWAKKFSWDESASEMMSIIEHVVNGS
ncbi:glycosyltransferase family 4 protein [bacterium]|nr:glycosyltransferase family 4 protein [bacterium]RQV92069.1 MAG: glycosyltransferase family 1 protein [bacterium]